MYENIITVNPEQSASFKSEVDALDSIMDYVGYVYYFDKNGNSLEKELFEDKETKEKYIIVGYENFNYTFYQIDIVSIKELDVIEIKIFDV